MPWSVKENDDRCPMGEPWAVVKDSDNSLEGCHATEEMAKNHQAALYANMPESKAGRPPKDNLVRAMLGEYEVRDTEDGDAPTLFGHFATFGDWTQIDSAFEGHFMERIAPGAFSKTIAENRSNIKVLFQHGQDPQLGDKPIASIKTLREDERGAYYEASLLDGVPPLVVSGLRAGEYGASFRFSVVKEDFDHAPKRSAMNPEGLPERTIKEARLYEFGPVVFPAYATASAGLRSLTDAYRQSIGTPTPEALPNDGAEPAHSDAGSRGQPPEPVAPPKENRPVDELTRDEKVSKLAALKANVAALADATTGELPVEQQARWDADNREIDQLERDIRAFDARQRRVDEILRNAPGSQEAILPNFNIIKQPEDLFDVRAIERGSRSKEERDEKLRGNALRVAEQMRVTSPRYDQDKSRERLVDLIDNVDSEDHEIAQRTLATMSPAYRAAFNRYVKTGGQERGTALAVGVDATGGYAVPVSFDPTVVAIGAWTAINPFRAACRVVTISGTDTWQALTATAITAAYALEAAAATEQGPTFARPEFIAKRAHAYVTASYEMMQDRADLAAELGTLFGEAKDTLEENQFSIGAGTTVYPQGMGLKDAYTRVDSVTNDTVAVADIRAVEAALPIRHRLNAAWFLSRAAIRAIQAFETSGGQLFSGVGYPAVGNPVNNRTGNTGLTLLGYPIWETPSMPWTPTTDDTTYGVLCNPQTYVIVDRVGMSVRVIADVFDGATPSMPTGESGIYAFWRNTARVLNVDGGRQGAVQ